MSPLAVWFVGAVTWGLVAAVVRMRCIAMAQETSMRPGQVFFQMSWMWESGKPWSALGRFYRAWVRFGLVVVVLLMLVAAALRNHAS